MTKFLRLIGNEWKKEFHKKSLWVMLIVLALLTALYAVGVVMADDPYGYTDHYYSFEELCEDEISWNEEMLNDATVPAEELDFYRINVETNRLMLETEMDWNDWRYLLDLARLAVEAKYEGDADTYNALLLVIQNNDVVGYYAWQKGAYEKMYATDAARMKIYTDAVAYCVDNEIFPHPLEDPRYVLVQDVVKNSEIILLQEQLKETGGAWSPAKLEEAKNALVITNYQLENGMNFNPADSFASDPMADLFLGFEEKPTSPYWNAMASAPTMLSLVSVFVIVLGGGTIANEYSAGTIKFLLIAPVKRWKILMSKYATVLLFGLMMSAVVLVMSMVPSLMLRAGEALLPAVFAESGEIYLTSPYLLLLGNYMLSVLEIFVMATLAFTLSALTRKSSTAVSTTIALDLMGSIVTYVLAAFGCDWSRYLLFANLDLSAIASGATVYPHQSLVGAIVIVVIHMAVFLLTAHDAFVRKDI